MKVYTGIPVSSGTGIGPAYFLQKNTINITCHTVTDAEKQSDWKKFEVSRNKAIDELSQQLASASKEQGEILSTHLMMLSDPEFSKEVKDAYDAGNICIEHVLNTKVNEFADRLRNSGNDYLIDRANDITDAYERVFLLFFGMTAASRDDIPENSVIIGKTMNPSDALLFSEKHVAAILTSEGGKNSHLAILARTYEIPYVSGLPEDFFTAVSEDAGSPVIVDGRKGTVICSPDEDSLAAHKAMAEEEQIQKKLLARYKGKPAATKDGVQLQLLANISSPEEAVLSEQLGADGAGLFRTEFFFMNKKDLSEEDQFMAYRKAIDALKGKPVTIRTLDAGGDKIIDAEGFKLAEQEKNPLLGCRAIRFCLSRRDIFKTQIRALLRAGLDRNLNVMIPMITSQDELKAVKDLISEAEAELKAAGKAYSSNVPVGIMVETPAAAMTAEELAGSSSFFSVGTNDLTQYTMCIDRENTSVAGLYREFHPAVIRLISRTAQAAAEAGIPVSVCGELAGRPAGAFLLFGLGIRKLSVNPAYINRLKAMFALFSEAEIKEITDKAVSLRNSDETERYIMNAIKERM